MRDICGYNDHLGRPCTKEVGHSFEPGSHLCDERYFIIYSAWRMGETLEYIVKQLRCVVQSMKDRGGPA